MKQCIKCLSAEGHLFRSFNSNRLLLLILQSNFRQVSTLKPCTQWRTPFIRVVLTKTPFYFTINLIATQNRQFFPSSAGNPQIAWKLLPVVVLLPPCFMSSWYSIIHPMGRLTHWQLRWLECDKMAIMCDLVLAWYCQ